MEKNKKKEELWWPILVGASSFIINLILWGWLFPNARWFIAIPVSIIVVIVIIVADAFVLGIQEGMKEYNNANGTTMYFKGKVVASASSYSSIDDEPTREEKIKNIKANFDWSEQLAIKGMRITNWKNKKIQQCGEDAFYGIVSDWCDIHGGFDLDNHQQDVDKIIAIHLRKDKIQKLMKKL